MTTIKEKLSVPSEDKKVGYLKDIWNSLFNPDIKPVEEDNLSVKGIIMLLETVINSVKCMGTEFKQLEYQKEMLQNDLKTVRKQNDILKEKVELQVSCRQCPELEKKLADQVKQTTDCKRSIKSIFAILKPTLTEENRDETQKALAETQSLMGKYFGEEAIIVPETPSCTAPVIRHIDNNDRQIFDHNVKARSLKESPSRICTPKKENGKKIATEKSPIMKSVRRRTGGSCKGSQEEAPPPKEQNSSKHEPHVKSSRLEWKLKTDDANTGNRQPSLKQATLAVKARPRLQLKRDLSMMDGFSGGTLSANSNSSADERHCPLSEDDDCITESPVSSKKSSFGHVKKRLKKPSKEQDTSTDKLSVISMDDTLFAPIAASTSNVNPEEEKEEQKHSSNKLYLKKDNASTSSDFKYQRDAVRKKSERMNLQGWSCDDCEKYYAAMEKNGMNVSEIKKTMNKCSRHRSKYAKSSTPPGFWNPTFDTSDED